MASASTHQAPFSASALQEWLLMSAAGRASVGTVTLCPCVVVLMSLCSLNVMFTDCTCALNVFRVYSHIKLFQNFQTCVRSSATWPMKMSAAGLLSQENTVWMPAVVQWAWPGAPSVTSVQRKALQNMPSSVLVDLASPTGVTSSTAGPSSKVTVPSTNCI